MTDLPAVAADRRFQQSCLTWAIDAFGASAENGVERALRVAEEAIELAQAAGAPSAMIDRLTRRVYGQPPGNVHKEIGQVFCTLASLAENIGVSAMFCGMRELDRCVAGDLGSMRERYARKIAAGYTMHSILPDGNLLEYYGALTQPRYREVQPHSDHGMPGMTPAAPDGPPSYTMPPAAPLPPPAPTEHRDTIVGEKPEWTNRAPVFADRTGAARVWPTYYCPVCSNSDRNAYMRCNRGDCLDGRDSAERARCGIT